MALIQYGGGSGGGGGGTITGSGTARTFAIFTGATAIGDSKLTRDATILGRVTLYDDTAATGVTQFVLRAGAGQGSNQPFMLLDNAGTTTLSQIDETGAYTVGTTTTLAFLADSYFTVGSGYQINWSSGTPGSNAADVGLIRSGSLAGTIQVTDGSSGAGLIAVGKGNATQPGFCFEALPGSGMYATNSSMPLGFAADGVGSIMTSDNGGNVAFAGSISTTGGSITGRDSIFQVTSNSSVDVTGAIPFRVRTGAWYEGWTTKTLTESAATGFVDIALAQNTVIGGMVEYVVRTTNGTDYSVESGQLFFTAASKTNGTVDDADVGLVGTPIQSTTTANSWTNTFTVTKGTNKITLNCNSVSSLSGADTIDLFYVVHLNGAQTETITGL